MSKLTALHSFRRSDLTRLVRILGIPDPFYTSKQNKLPAIEALALLLARLAFPSRLVDLEDKFGYIRRETISMVIQELTGLIYDQWAAKLLHGFNRKLLTPERLDLYAATIHTRGCPMEDIWGFMDVTFDFCCRPGSLQDVMYSGYKKAHTFKYNAVATPDGLIVHCSIPVEGRRADGGVYSISGFGPLLERYAYGVGGRRLFVYADPAYGVSNTVISAPKEVDKLPPEEQEFYTKMSRFRMCVEWAFGKVFNYFAALTFKRNRRLHQSVIAKHFAVAVLLINAHTCLYGSVTSRTFHLPPPSLEEYFSLD